MSPNKIADIRRVEGITQQQLADAAGVSRNQMSLIENGKSKPSFGTALKISSKLDIPITELADIINK